MLSYPDFLPSGRWRTMVEKEKITDLVLSDIMITPDMWPSIEKAKEELGLRNIILLHSRLGGPCSGPAELVYNEFNCKMLRRLDGTVFMDDLLKKHANTPITYGSGDPEHIAVITHTSGTTKGTRKPLPYTDRAVNSVASNAKGIYQRMVGKDPSKERFRIMPSFDFSSFLCMCGLVNVSLAGADCVVLTFFGFMHPKFVRAVGYYRLNVICTSGFMVDGWMNRPDTDDIDFSSLEVFACGGSYIPPDKLRQYTKFVHDHGYKGSIQRGYGMSETGGAQLTVPDGCMDDILGFPVPEDNFMIKDENDGNYYKACDGVRTGVMYVASDSLCLNTLDGEELFEYTVIDGRDFICTNDLVRVNSDGSFSYAGRADRYFVNNDGVRFNAGTVDTELSKQPGISKCAVVPVLDKRIHDTVPALYIVPEEKGEAAIEIARKALVQIFIKDDLIRNNSLPSQFILVDDIPCNSNGKIDIYRITRERLKGEAYNILPVHTGEVVTDIETEYADQLDSITGGTLPEGMGGGSAMGIYDLFNSQSSQQEKRPMIDLCGLWRANNDRCKRKLKGLFHNTRERKKMFNFYDDDKNPFMFMMNMSNDEEKEKESPMQFMQQAFSMQMQMMQTVMTTQMQMMQTMTNFIGMAGGNAFAGFGQTGNFADSDEAVGGAKAAGDAKAADTGKGAAADGAEQNGFKLGKMNIPPELLGKLMQMDMTPENLEKLQGVLDYMFSKIPDSKEK